MYDEVSYWSGCMPKTLSVIEKCLKNIGFKNLQYNMLNKSRFI